MTAQETLNAEIARRRTFAIISHPDAGKTTLTEKLLLYGGAIRMAGSVKARKAARHATSDWMEIEKQRGISVASSVMAFDYEGFRVNILDTPGHQDFSEDTYRTLVAADSAVMLIDAAKGVEEQTVKLFHVCRMRGIPIFTYINKLDRACRDPFELLEELERVLGIRACPINWPIGVHGDFQGVYFLDEKNVELYQGGNHGQTVASATTVPLGQLRDAIDGSYVDTLLSEVELLEGAGDELDLSRVTRGELTPVFFGSAMNNFGVAPFLERFLKYTHPPAGRSAAEGEIPPDTPDFTGFIFKIQANMNPAHRDRIAFMRVCSGRFAKGMEVWHSGSAKPIKLAQPQQFMADERAMIDEAYPGDIVGLFDPGLFRLGDALSSGKPVHYEGIPVFAPEHFARVSPIDSLKRKQFVKGVTQLSEEGAIQTFRRTDIGLEQLIVGVVGILQFEVLEYRLQGEYGVEIKRDTLGFQKVAWITGLPAGVAADDLKKLKLTSTTMIAYDRWDNHVLLFENEWSVRWAQDNNKGLELSDVAPRSLS